MADREKTRKQKSDYEGARQRRVKDAKKEAMALLAAATPAGQVWQHLRQKYNVTEQVADTILRNSLTGLMPAFGYLSAQIRAVSQTALQKLVNQSRTEAVRLSASKRLRRYFVQPETPEVEECPEFMRTIEERTTGELLAERERLRKEYRSATSRRRAPKIRNLSPAWERSTTASEVANKTETRYARMQEIMVLLSHPFRTAEIVEIMAKRYKMPRVSTESLINEATKFVERNANLHPIQIELLNQKLSVDILKSDESTDQDKLKAIDTLLDSAPADANKSDAQDAAGMQLSSRCQRLDDLLPNELDTLIGDLWKDARKRWKWKP